MMGFWVFMLMADLLIPLAMIGFGSYFIKRAPKKINMVFGYRTPRSMKNQDTWKFAHGYCGKLWRVTGCILLVVSVIAMLPALYRDEGFVGSYGGILCLLQLIPMTVPIFMTERALKKTFDENGNRRQ